MRHMVSQNGRSNLLGTRVNVDGETSGSLMRLSCTAQAGAVLMWDRFLRMAFASKALAAAGALLATLAFAGAASAQAAKPKPDPARPTVAEALRLGPPPTTSLQFNEKGRWGLNLNVDEPARRDRRLDDVEAGAFFRLTPSVRVGGSVRLDDKAKPERLAPDERRPRVRVEGKFRF